MQIKEIFLNAIISGELGKIDNSGIVIELCEFKAFFKAKIKTDYINSFLPAATIETGQHSASHTKYLFRIRKGKYRVHPDAIEEQIKINEENDINKINEIMPVYHSYEKITPFKLKPLVKKVIGRIYF